MGTHALRWGTIRPGRRYVALSVFAGLALLLLPTVADAQTPVITSPSAPLGVQANPLVRAVAVTWTAPASDGGAPISAFVVRATPVAATIPAGAVVPVRSTLTSGNATSAQVTQLTNGVSYTISVSARNSAVATYGPTSGPAGPIQMPVAPTPPVVEFANGLVRAAAVGWTRPANAASVPITKYTVVAAAVRSDATIHKITKSVTPLVGATEAATTATVSGLIAGLAYTFTVSATDAVGTSLPSAPFGPVLLPAAPTAPTITVATALIRAVHLEWTATPEPRPITKYTVTASALRADGTAHRVTKTVTTGLATDVTGLIAGLAYTFTVNATNDVGTGPSSSPFGPVALAAPPVAPVITDADPLPRAASVTWLRPANDPARPITKYTVTATAARIDGSIHRVTKTILPLDGSTEPALSTTVTALTTGLAYTFTVTATDDIGTSPASAPVGPIALPIAPGTPTISAATGLVRGAHLEWTAPESSIPIISYTVTGTTPRPTATSPDAVYRITKTVLPVNGASSPPTSVDLTGLRPGDVYTFAITATNAAGIGPSSTPSGALKIPAGPTPTYLESIVPLVGGVRATWARPTPGLGPITRYHVRAWTHGHSVTTTVLPVNGALEPATEIEITGLIPGLPYNVLVSAVDITGTGISGYTPQVGPAVPSAIPSAPVPAAPVITSAVVDDGIRSADVSWTAPAGSQIRVYTVEARAERPDGSIVRSSSFTSSTTGAAPTSVRIEHMEPGLAYTFTVTASTTVATSAPSAPFGPVAPI